jgi:hypothetical protein
MIGRPAICRFTTCTASGAAANSNIEALMIRALSAPWRPLCPQTLSSSDAGFA